MEPSRGRPTTGGGESNLKCRKSYGEPLWLITLPFARNGGAISADVVGHFADNGVPDRHFNGISYFPMIMVLMGQVVVPELSLNGKKSEENRTFFRRFWVSVMLRPFARLHAVCKTRKVRRVNKYLQLS